VSLPEIIEIVPLDRPVDAEIVVPGSKSITNRTLILAALGERETTLLGALWSEDTQIMVGCLERLGYKVSVVSHRYEPCNRTITVYGKGGAVPRGGTEQMPLDLYVGNAGTAARFLAALVCLGHGVYRLHGVPRMHERPQSRLFQALRQLGYRVDSANDKLPALIYGAGPRPGKCRVGIEESSQFASALLLCAARGGWEVAVEGESAEEASYVRMTLALTRVLPKSGPMFRIEPDASSSSYFWAADYLLNSQWDGGSGTGHGRPVLAVAASPQPGWQIDAAFPRFLPLPNRVSRQTDLGDSLMTAAVLAPFSAHPVRFTELGSLRLQECERVAALRTELTRCGAQVLEEGDTLTVHPSRLHGAEIETYHDHRMAMCFAILGLKVPGIKLKNPSCVKKTFPNFFQKLAGAPPHGLGVTILDAKTGQALSGDGLTPEGN
jgi:3-phosphoshikimate 1-carboxyvinyltransferase